MKKSILLFTIIFLNVFQFAYSQEEKGNHTFKIVGSTKLANPQGEQTVEYDPNSPDHLFITNFNKEGIITSKRQCLFTGKKFDLSADYVAYVSKKEIVADGTTTFYNKDGAINRTSIVKEGKLLQNNIFYPGGQQQSMIPGSDILDGVYKTWYQNGQLSFSGNYKNNFKNGDFEQFDQSGALIKKGVYQEGKLVSGEPVIQNTVYGNPEIPAKYNLGETAFDEYLTKKAVEAETMKIIFGNKNIYLDIVIDKTGKIIKLQNISSSYEAETVAINAIFKDCPNFIPATIENVPVQSFQKISLVFSKEGVKMKHVEKIYSPESVDEIPIFPGGSMALRNFISSNLKYPVLARQSGIQGKVIVGLVIDSDGSVTDVKILKGIHPLLDAEAIRVISLVPKHAPARLQGKSVRVAYAMPVTFKTN